MEKENIGDGSLNGNVAQDASDLLVAEEGARTGPEESAGECTEENDGVSGESGEKDYDGLFRQYGQLQIENVCLRQGVSNDALADVMAIVKSRVSDSGDIEKVKGAILEIVEKYPQFIKGRATPAFAVSDVRRVSPENGRMAALAEKMGL